MYDCGNHSAAPARAMSSVRSSAPMMAEGFLGGLNPTIAIAGLILATSLFKR